MSLVYYQNRFAKNLARLLNEAFSLGYIISIGEVYRPLEMQKLYIKQGKSKTLKSKHLDKLAVDLQIFQFKNGRYKYLTECKHYKELAKIWKQIDPLNEWGGDWRRFKDCGHFQLNKNKKLQKSLF
jgi:peptidoglycan L-alanyl-D-glutamate endopeptidase CwlK